MAFLLSARMRRPGLVLPKIKSPFAPAHNANKADVKKIDGSFLDGHFFSGLFQIMVSSPAERCATRCP